jgi:hypothetical protein
MPSVFLILLGMSYTFEAAAMQQKCQHSRVELLAHTTVADRTQAVRHARSDYPHWSFALGVLSGTGERIIRPRLHLVHIQGSVLLFL